MDESSHDAGEMVGAGLAGLRLGDCVLGVGVGVVSDGLGDGWAFPLDDHALLFRVAGIHVVVLDRRRNGGWCTAWLDRRGSRHGVTVISWGGGTSASSEFNNSRAGESVFCLGVEDVLVEDAGVGIRVSAREADQIVAARGASSRALDVDLNARRVELGTTLAVSKV